MSRNATAPSSATTARGWKSNDCGSVDIHIGGLATLAPLILFHAEDRDALRDAVIQHVDLTHKGEEMAAAAALYADLAFHLLHGATIDDALSRAEPAGHPALAFPYRDWAATRADDDVIGRQFSPACYLKDALPATLHLAVKYAGTPGDGLLANVRMGGDNCHRGVVLGTLLGAANGMPALPAEWVSGLYAAADCRRLLEALRARMS